jgi:hypothetical protein
MAKKKTNWLLWAIFIILFVVFVLPLILGVGSIATLLALWKLG